MKISTISFSSGIGNESKLGGRGIRPISLFSKLQVLLQVLCFMILVFQVHGEVFTAQSDLETLVVLRREVKSAIDLYLEKEQEKLDYLKRRIEFSKGFSSNAGSGNPINAFLLVKALTLDLAEIVTVIGNRDNFKEFAKSLEDLNEATKFPSGEDINGAALGLIRLQDTYRLDTKSLAKGAIGDSCCAPELSAEDCFELGKHSYNAKSYDYAIQWFTEALTRFPVTDEFEDETLPLSSLKNENDTTSTTILQTVSNRSSSPQKNSSTTFSSKVTKSEILNYLHWAQNIKKTVDIGKDFLAQLTGVELDAFLEQVAHVVSGQQQQQEDTQNGKPTLGEVYKMLCRGEVESKETSFSNPKLYCQYSTRGNKPFFMIGPVKEELVNADPPMWSFKNVIHEGEIETIKMLAKPKFETAMIVNVVTGSNVRSDTRISKSAWLDNGHHPLISKINKRIGYLTGLSMSSAELLQVANYGIGGMYLPHYDFAQPGQAANFMEKDGNRLATVLLYMSNVEKGGATVFTRLNLTLWPEKGSAVFWYNLRKNGEGDMRTQHAACPVLVGSKWVSNKWLHERGQEFRYPCGLENE